MKKINLKIFEKIAFLLLLIWILTPIQMLIFSPILDHWGARDIMYVILMIVGFLGLIMFCSNFIRNHKKDINYKNYLTIIFFVILIIWCLITCCTSIDKKLSIFGTPYRKDGLITYIAYFGVFCLPMLLKGEKYKNILFNVLIIVEVIIAIITLLNNNITYFLIGQRVEYVGTFSQFNHYGYYLMFGILMSLFMFLSKKDIKRYIYIISYILLLYTLVINDTFGCILSIIISLLMIIIYFRKYKKDIILVILSTLLIFTFTIKNDENIIYKNFKSLFADIGIIVDNKNNKDKIDSIGTSRGQLWKYGLIYIKEKPLTGYGIETLREVYYEDNVIQDRPHNVLIQFGAFTGIPGLLIYIMLILYTLYTSIKQIKRYNTLEVGILIIFLCYLMSSMFGNSMFYTSPYFFIFFGLLNANNVKKINKKKINFT